jgi:general secretion pathway protein L
MADKTLTIDLSAPARLADLPDMLGKFWVWWKRELLALTPWPGKEVAAPAAQNVTLYIRRNVWFLKPPSPGQDPVSLDTNAGDGELAEQILRSGADLPLSRLMLLLPRDHVLLRRLELPQMPEARIRQAVELQIDRMSPFKSDAVRFAAKVAARDIVQGTMQVEIAIVPLARLEPIERRLTTLGFTPMAVDVEGEGGVALGFDLKPPADAEALRSRRNLNLGLGAGAAALWLLAIFAWNQAADRDIAAWQERIASLRPAAERSAAIRRQLEETIVPVSLANTHDPARMLDILDELTKVLPDTTRVVELRIDAGEVQFSGLSTKAPELIGLLEGSPRFKDAKFVSPVIRKPDSDIERFDLSLHVEGRGAP